MKLLPISKVTSGMVLAKPILNKNGATLLGVGSILNEEKINIIKNEKNVLQLCVFETNEGKNIINSKNDFSSFYKKKFAEKLSISTPEEIYALSSKLVTQVKDRPEISNDLLDVRTKDDALYRHSICVALLCVSYGIKECFKEKDLKDLCAAALLHDIGKKHIPNEILYKNGELTPEEFEVMKLHTTYGYNMLKKEYDIPSRVKVATLLHHENWNGTGYPMGKQKDEIHLFARIIRIADTFDALVTERVYHKPMSSQEAIDYIMENTGSFYDPVIAKKMFKDIFFNF